MANHKARVVFSDEVWKIIEWLTYNYDLEIGALGNVKTIQEEGEEPYFYVDKLFFPKQEVTAATVTFTPEMWGDLIKEYGLDGLKDIAFYWHRHPGNSAHSGTDDLDTFEAFMSKEANRDKFIFMQTAVSDKEGWNEEIRIDLRRPIRQTILHKDIDVEVEQTPEDEELRAYCEKMIKENVTRKVFKALPRATTPYVRNQWKGQQKLKNVIDFSRFEKLVTLPKVYKTIESAIDDDYFGEIVGDMSFNNDCIDGYWTRPEEKMDVSVKDGKIVVLAGKDYQEIIDKVLEEKPKVKLFDVMRGYKKEQLKETVRYEFQPKKKKFLDLKEVFVKSYFAFNSDILQNLSDEERLSPNEEIVIPGKLPVQFESIEGDENIQYVISELEGNCEIDWSDAYNAIVYDLERQEMLGQLSMTPKGDKLIVTGEDLKPLVNNIQADLIYGDEVYLDMAEEEQ